MASLESGLLFSWTVGVLENLRRCRLLNLSGEVRCNGLAYLGCKPLAQRLGVVRINSRIFGRAGDGDMGKPGVNRVAAKIGIDISDDSACGESLGAVRSDGVAVVVLPELPGVEVDGTLLLAVHKDGEAVGLHLRDGTHVPVRDAQFLVQGGELQAGPDGELAAGFPTDVHAVDAHGA